MLANAAVFHTSGRCLLAKHGEARVGLESVGVELAA
jgi:hypothetical protein